MFFIMGISQGQKRLNFDQTVVCRNCGKYGHLEVYMVYSYLSLFFIPVFRWGCSYYVRTTCCGRTVPVSQELGRSIASGQVTALPEDMIPEGTWTGTKRCGVCGFETKEDYRFCPGCGAKL